MGQENQAGLAALADETEDAYGQSDEMFMKMCRHYGFDSADQYILKLLIRKAEERSHTHQGVNIPTK
jgi:hypothetical protein